MFWKYDSSYMGVHAGEDTVQCRYVLSTCPGTCLGACSANAAGAVDTYGVDHLQIPLSMSSAQSMVAAQRIEKREINRPVGVSTAELHEKHRGGVQDKMSKY